MHIVLGMSPIGSTLRTRLRMFPSLVNCCTIDWFDPWPKQALQMVAEVGVESVRSPVLDSLRLFLSRELVALENLFCTQAHFFTRLLAHHSFPHLFIHSLSHSLARTHASHVVSLCQVEMSDKDRSTVVTLCQYVQLFKS